MTESTAVGTRGFNTEKFRNCSSIGLLAPNMEAKVVDFNSGEFLPPGSSGELWLRGPSIMRGKKSVFFLNRYKIKVLKRAIWSIPPLQIVSFSYFYFLKMSMCQCCVRCLFMC